MNFRDVLEEKRGDLLDQIKHIRQSMAELTKQLAVKEAQLQNVEQLIRLEGEPTERSPSTTGDSAPLTTASLMDSVEALLKDTGRPMHYQAITQRIQADGLHIPGRNPAANLLTQMTRDGRFRKTARGTYALARTATKK